METRIAQVSDIPDILRLQDRYLFDNLSEAERQQGFVTTPFTTDQLLHILGVGGLFLVLEQHILIGYAFAGSWDYFSQWPIFPFMCSRFPDLSFLGKKINTHNSFQYGPVCIDLAYRGKGILQLLFERLRLVMMQRYPLSITFINKLNLRSYQAHTKKLGWEVIDEFNFKGREYWGLAYDMHKKIEVPLRVSSPLLINP